MDLLTESLKAALLKKFTRLDPLSPLKSKRGMPNYDRFTSLSKTFRNNTVVITRCSYHNPCFMIHLQAGYL
jgi:hypothetical protein